MKARATTIAIGSVLALTASATPAGATATTPRCAARAPQSVRVLQAFEWGDGVAAPTRALCAVKAIRAHGTIRQDPVAPRPYQALKNSY